MRMIDYPFAGRSKTVEPTPTEEDQKAMADAEQAVQQRVKILYDAQYTVMKAEEDLKNARMAREELARAIAFRTRKAKY